jgi:type IV secretion system protein VirD4
MSTTNGFPFGYTSATKRFPTYSDDRHLCTFGPTRSGKGATVIIPTLLQVPHSVVVNDPKGQNAAVTARRRRELGQRVINLNPYRLHTGPPWNLSCDRYNPLTAFDINNPRVVADVEALAQALIVTEGREPYFDDTARDLVTTLVLYLVSTLGKKATLGHVRKMLTDIAVRGKEAARILVAISKSPHRFIAQPIGRFMDAEARDISSAVNTAITQTGFLDDPALTDPERGVLSASDFDMGELKWRPTTVNLILPGEYMVARARFLRVMITAALDKIMAAPGGHPVLMLLDEYYRLGRLEAVSSAFSYAAGFNLQLWPFLQDIPQLQELYGKKWMSLIANSGMTQFFTPTEMETADYLQRRGGYTTGENLSRNYSGTLLKQGRGESRSEARVPLLPPERVMSLPHDQSIVFFAGKHDPLIAERQPYWKIPRLAGMYDPDPYHPGP